MARVTIELFVTVILYLKSFQDKRISSEKCSVTDRMREFVSAISKMKHNHQFTEGAFRSDFKLKKSIAREALIGSDQIIFF